MANMGYCRFYNTVEDLRDCIEHWDDTESEEELRKRDQLLKMCKQIAAEYAIDEDDE